MNKNWVMMEPTCLLLCRVTPAVSFASRLHWARILITAAVRCLTHTNMICCIDKSN